MTPPASPTAPPRPMQLVLWVIWFAFLNGVIFYRLFLAKDPAAGAPPPADAFPWAYSLLPVLLSGAVRWTLLPLARDARQALVYMVLGIALAEVTCFFGIYLTPSKLNLLCGASFIGVFQFAPTWAARFFEPEEMPPTPNVVPKQPR